MSRVSPHRRTPTRERFRPWRRWDGESTAPVAVGSSVLVFALSGLAALVVVSLGVLSFARTTARNEAIQDSKRLTEIVGRSLIQPALEDGLLRGDRGAVERLDRIVRSDILNSSIVRVKLWSRDGVVVYSDESRLIGQRYALRADDVGAFSSHVAEADVSDLSRPENAYERVYEKLLEVYLPVTTPNGTPLLFEAYLPYASVSVSGDQIWLNFLPALVAGLVVLEIAQLPLAWTLARGLRRRQDERELLLTRAVESSERERRLIAAELHDGAVQDLLGQSYRLVAVADRLAGTVPEDSVRAIRDAAAQTRNTVQGLRSLLVDLYPPNLRSEGIESALADLAAPLRARGVEIAIDSATDVRLDEPTERLLYRAAREALRNVQQHAHARQVRVALRSDGPATRLTVEDDGCGFTTEERARKRSRGHLGLDLIEGIVHDQGGRVAILPRPGGGTRVEIEIPTS